MVRIVLALVIVLAAFICLTGCFLTDVAEAGLVIVECDEKPADLEHHCDVSLKNCEDWIDSQCRFELKMKPSDPLTPAYEECWHRRIRECDAKKAKCMTGIRRCPSGKTCKESKCQ